MDGLLDKYKELTRIPNKDAVKKAHISGILFGYGQYVKFAIIGLIFYISSILLEKYDLNPEHTFIAVYCIFMGAIGTGAAFSQVPNVAQARSAAVDVFEIVDEESQMDTRKQQGEKVVSKGEI